MHHRVPGARGWGEGLSVGSGEGPAPQMWKTSATQGVVRWPPPQGCPGVGPPRGVPPPLVASSLSVPSVKWVCPISENTAAFAAASALEGSMSAGVSAPSPGPGWLHPGGVPRVGRRPLSAGPASSRQLRPVPSGFPSVGPWLEASGGPSTGLWPSPPHAATLRARPLPTSAPGPTGSLRRHGTHQGGSGGGGSVRQGCPRPPASSGESSRAGPGVRSPGPRQSWALSEEEVRGPSPGALTLGWAVGTEPAHLESSPALECVTPPCAIHQWEKPRVWHLSEPAAPARLMSTNIHFPGGAL